MSDYPLAEINLKTSVLTSRGRRKGQHSTSLPWIKWDFRRAGWAIRMSATHSKRLWNLLTLGRRSLNHQVARQRFHVSRNYWERGSHCRYDLVRGVEEVHNYLEHRNFEMGGSQGAEH